MMSTATARSVILPEWQQGAVSAMERKGRCARRNPWHRPRPWRNAGPRLGKARRLRASLPGQAGSGPQRQCRGPSPEGALSASRPSRRSAGFSTAVSTVGVLRGPGCLSCPIQVARPSSPPSHRVWQPMHDTVADADGRGPRNSDRPSAVRSGVTVWPASPAIDDGRGGKHSSPCRAEGPPAPDPTEPAPTEPGQQERPS